MDKITLTQAIHDLKSSFRKFFGPDIPITSEIEQAINLAARDVKKGYTADWVRTESGAISIKLNKPRRWRPLPGTNSPNNRKYKG